MENKKTYLKDFELYMKAYNNCDGFKSLVWNDAAAIASDELWYGDVVHDLKGVDYENHYTSFYCTLADYNEFILSLKDIQYNYGILDIEDEKLFIKVYAAYERFNSMSYGLNYIRLEHWLIKQCVYLLGKVEEYLHSYESDEYIETIINDEFSSSHYEKYYILNDDFSSVYYDYTKRI